ncbi:acetyl-CoA carboxylase biotin carboxyl carrier protein [Chlorogloeopsis fritschii PCC 9212]|uniref:Biotin carboxyl carrier protein of acetyl-CoA carboxylase n=1 Tax=Chlorogloeopsis fritschii PCC 6912 TaxID=211165 RepID=A0A433NMH4_CHLFR|nr:acetyl-CoA carboxylase biotin carboxyl carrier protein [Chlorogloeopsis fritschii]RUR84262.1 acetyl-CoA carboxylase, biotin carboxyl carrier protein [Chlorogloeopsis fritschii PCC 6912]
MPLDFNEIRQLLTTIAQTDITEVTLKSDDFEITVRKATIAATGAGVSTGLSSVSPIAPPVAPPPTAEVSRTYEAPTSVSTAPAPSPIEQKKYVEVTSPMVGTFYRASAPGEAPFVEVGDRIRSGQTVCIIEAMKLMNEIEAEVSGQIIEILVQNGEPVEYGQPLMRINPD